MQPIPLHAMSDWRNTFENYVSSVNCLMPIIDFGYILMTMEKLYNLCKLCNQYICNLWGTGVIFRKFVSSVSCAMTKIDFK